MSEEKKVELNEEALDKVSGGMVAGGYVSPIRPKLGDCKKCGTKMDLTETATQYVYTCPKCGNVMTINK